MLLDFLGKTNSKMTLDPKQITFLFAGRVINQENDLKKTVGEIFKKKNNIPIKVIDTNDVIGGKWIIYAISKYYNDNDIKFIFHYLVKIVNLFI